VNATPLIVPDAIGANLESVEEVHAARAGYGRKGGPAHAISRA
jgi:hypothetical protein